jgi:hypothetical protein
MKMPGGDGAIVDIAKLRDHCLSPVHARGRHKARVFASALGLSPADADFLRNELLRAAREGDVITGDADDHGQRYVIEFEIVRRHHRAIVRSAWIIRRGDTLPRFTSCYVL